MIKGWIQTDDLSKLKAQVERFPVSAKKNLAQTIRELAKQLRASARALAPRATGRLRSSIRYSVKTYSDAVIGRVWAAAPHAHLIEHGFQGEENVKAHMRTITDVFGHRMVSTRQVMVRAHTRRVNRPEESFMRWSLKEMEPQIKQDIGDAVSRALDDQS